MEEVTQKTTEHEEKVDFISKEMQIKTTISDCFVPIILATF